MKFDSMNRLFVSNNGYEVRGSRPIANALDEFFMVSPNLWYGWPDYSGGLPVNLPMFTPEGGAQPEFLLAKHPNDPPRPYTTFPVNSGIRGFDFDNNYDITISLYCYFLGTPFISLMAQSVNRNDAPYNNARENFYRRGVMEIDFNKFSIS